MLWKTHFRFTGPTVLSDTQVVCNLQYSLTLIKSFQLKLYLRTVHPSIEPLVILYLKECRFHEIIMNLPHAGTMTVLFPFLREESNSDTLIWAGISHCLEVHRCWRRCASTYCPILKHLIPAFHSSFSQGDVSTDHQMLQKKMLEKKISQCPVCSENRQRRGIIIATHLPARWPVTSTDLQGWGLWKRCSSNTGPAAKTQLSPAFQTALISLVWCAADPLCF